MYGMLQNLELVKARRYHNFLLNRQQSHINATATTVRSIPKPVSMSASQTRGKPIMVTGRRTFSMSSISGFKSSGGCGCGS